MKRNQLKLRMWSFLNGARFSENILQKIETEMSEEEIGALVNLFCDSEICKEFLSSYQTTEQLEQEFGSLDKYKQIAHNFLALGDGHCLVEMQHRVYGYRLEDVLVAFAQGRDEDQKSDLFCQAENALLDYLRVLRAKIDINNLDISKEEALLFSVLERDVDECFLAASFYVFTMYLDFIVDIERLEKIMVLNGPKVRAYVLSLKEVMDMVGYMTILLNENKR